MFLLRRVISLVVIGIITTLSLQAHALVIAGRVIDEKSAPVARARVSLIGFGHTSIGLGKIAGSAVTSDNGSFQIESTELPEAPGTTMQLMVESDGYAIAQASVTIPKPDAGAKQIDVPPITLAAPVTIPKPDAGAKQIDVPPITLAAPVRLRAQFLDAEGKPVGGLKIFLVQLADGREFGSGGFWVLSIPQEARDRLTRKTDADGFCTFEMIPPVSRVRFGVADERFAQISYENDILVGMQPQIVAPPVRLRVACSIRGRVTYEQTGKPAAKALVGVQNTNRDRGGGWGSAFTDEDGQYHIKQLPEGEYNVMLYDAPQNDKDWLAIAIDSLRLRSGSHREQQDLKLIKGSMITGEVILKDTGEAIPDAWVGAHTPARPKSGAAIQGVRTGKDGSFSLRVPPGKQYLYLAERPPDGYLEPRPWEGEVKPNQTLAVDIELPRDPAPPLAGRVVDAQNQPVAEAMVTTQRLNDFRGPRWVQTAKDGQFGFRAVAKGSVIEAQKGELKSERIIIQGTEDDLTLVIAKEVVASLLVSVEDKEGVAIKGAEVHLIATPPEGRTSDKIAGLTNEQGRLAIPKVPIAGTYRITVEAPGFRWNAEDVRPQLQADKERLVRVILKPK